MEKLHGSVLAAHSVQCSVVGPHLPWIVLAVLQFPVIRRVQASIMHHTSCIMHHASCIMHHAFIMTCFGSLVDVRASQLPAHSKDRAWQVQEHLSDYSIFVTLQAP